MNSPTRRYVPFAVMAVLVFAAVGAQAQIEDHQDIEGPFASGPEVTATCLECHDDVADAFMHTSHWKWTSLQEVPGHGEMEYGKKNVINNFCIAIDSNYPRCTSCHAGYGWKDGSFDFTKEENIDCLVCHDLSGTYKKFPTGAGHPAYEAKKWMGKDWPAVDLVAAARSVGMPTRNNCGACHFFGGGGDGVKHGDMDSSLKNPTVALDVHMAVDGADMACQECHKTSGHEIQGNSFASSPAGMSHLSCTECHDAEPHQKKKLNAHVKSVACQTCHIPAFARELPTKMNWDWSTAGQAIEAVKDENGKPNYAKKKGHFVWGKNVTPSYAWYNGQGGAYLLGDKIDPAAMTKLSWPMGDRDDHTALIYPFKIHQGKQAYDADNNYFVVPKLFGPGGYWKTWDWVAASTKGMEEVGLEFSGNVGFAATSMHWRINHMVAPASESLKCKDCHSKSGDGRMDWAALGYGSDPMRDKTQSRFAE